MSNLQVHHQGLAPGLKRGGGVNGQIEIKNY